MKKLISIFTLLFFYSLSVFAGPFGLDMGMTIEDVTKACGLGICIPNGMLRDFAAARQESS